MQNRPPGAVVAINNLFGRAADSIKNRVYRYKGRGKGRYCITNTKNGHTYTFTLEKANCNCVYRVTNEYKLPCIHAMVLIIRLKLDWSYFNLGVRRNIRNSLIKYDDEGWTVLGTPGMNEDKATVNFFGGL